MSKHILDSDYDYDFSILAISAHIPDYRISIEINHLLDITLSRDISIELSTKSTSTPLLFSCFSFVDEGRQSDFILLANKSSNTVSSLSNRAETLSLFKEESNDVKLLLIPELAQSDFLLLLKADNHTQLANDILNKLKTINFVLSVQNIDPETLHSKKNLII